jgi:hypothetical protein
MLVKSDTHAAEKKGSKTATKQNRPEVTLNEKKAKKTAD